VEGLRGGAVGAVRADLALRAVADAEHLQPTDDDIDEEIERLAASYQTKPAQLRRNLERADQMPAVRSEWKKSKALDWLVEHADVVDTDGQPVDRTLLEPDVEPETSEDPAPTEDPTSTEDTSQDPQTGEA
jgi:trigger factor